MLFYAVAAKPEGAAVEAESGGGAGRKRRWGSSTAVTAKKPSISITTESLKVQNYYVIINTKPSVINQMGSLKYPQHVVRDTLQVFVIPRI